ncbi:MAG TPA: hypothetical protein H9694_03255 [Firmicutes bacterium]|nr:hypothetical protein [Bacillota bacterium]
MKKIGTLLLGLLLSGSLGLTAAAATQSTSYTVTLTINGKEEVSQDAYTPSKLYMGLGLNKAEDLYIANDRMYIADTGNKRVLVVDIATGEITVVGEELLSSPTGVAADEEGRIYVADSGTREAYRFAQDGTLEQTFAKPTTPNFGVEENYIPVKIAASGNGGCYIVSEGTSAGVIYMGATGDFLGYFASNTVNRSLYDIFVDLVFSEEQKAQLASVQAASFANIFRGSDGLVYTINRGDQSRIKKNSINGVDMLQNNDNLPQLNRLSDLCVTDDGRMIAVDSTGYITEISFDGYLLCRFGGSAGGSEKVGLFSTPSGVAADSEDNIYVLDSASNYIQVFTPTHVQSQIHAAMERYNNGQYDDSIAILTDVMKYNNSSYFAHLYLGLNYMQKGDYAAAEDHFRTANAKEQYSEAYWESRNEWLQSNLMYVLVAFLALVVVIYILRRVNRKKHIFAGVAAVQASLKKKSRFYYDICQIPFAFRHPLDNSYNVRKGETGTYLSATVIYLAVLLLIILDQTAAGFIFSADMRSFSLGNTVTIYVCALALFLVSHYFISAINDGESTFRSTYIAMAYSLSPIVLFLPWLIILSNFATMDEGYLIYTVLSVLIALCVVYVFLAIIETQQYTFRQTVFNVLVTLFFMAVLIFALSISYLLIKQVVDFVTSIITEVNLRA